MTVPAMFKITQNTFRYFTLAQVLLMAAINQIEDKRKVNWGVRKLADQLGVGHGR